MLCSTRFSLYRNPGTVRVPPKADGFLFFLLDLGGKGYQYHSIFKVDLGWPLPQFCKWAASVVKLGRVVIAAYFVGLEKLQ